MAIDVSKTKDGKVLLKVYSNLDNRKIANELKEAFQNLYDKGEKAIVLDLDNVEMINSYGVGKVLMFYNRLKNRGGELYTLAPLKGQVKVVFETLMLTNLLKEYKK